MYQHLKLSPPMGRLLCSPPDAISLGGRPYLTSQTDTDKQEGGFHLGGVNYGRKVWGGGFWPLLQKEQLHIQFGTSASNIIARVKNLHVGVKCKPAERSPSSADFCLAQKNAVGGFSLAQEILVPSARIKKLCVLQCWKWVSVKENAIPFLFRIRSHSIPFEHRIS